MIIPKEELANFQRWQAGSFDKKPATNPLPAPAPAAAAAAEAVARTTAAQAEPLPAIKLPTAEDVENILEEARARGFEAGLAEGKAAGEHLAIEAAEASAQRFNALLENLKVSLKDLEQTVADQLLALAIEIAGQLTRGSIAAKPDILLPIIREAITTLPMHHAHVVLRLNPVDADNVRALLGEEFAQTGTQIVEDQEISLGGCLLEAGSSEVDASIETRWKRVLEAIGTEPQAWLNP